jgi:hypothetical protein
METTIVSTSFRSAHVITTIEEPEPIRRRVELTVVSYTLPLPIEFVEILVVVRLEELQQI